MEKNCILRAVLKRSFPEASVVHGPDPDDEIIWDL